MPASSKSRKYFALPFFGSLAVLIFSSWGNIPHLISLRELAGADAFKTTVTNHTLALKDEVISYQATTGYTSVSNSENHTAQLFYTAYTTGVSNRPLTFVFNGGPGSSSIWLHMGSFGPVRAVPGKAGYQYNPDTWLGFTDLVFIDPIGTGYSRPEDGTAARRFYGYHEDIQAIATFISNYLKENHRDGSPLFLAGESYGAARAVGLAAYLQDTLKTNVAGLTLISPALNYKLVSFRKDNDTPYPYYLATYALAAQFHQRLSSQLQALTASQLEARVNQFAFGAYKAALSNQVVSSTVIDTLSYYTGLDVATLRRLNGRVSDNEFAHLLLKSTTTRLGIYDDRDTASVNIDPSEQKLRDVFPGAFADYSKTALHYTNKLNYLATIATPTWNYGPEMSGGYLNVVPLLQHLLISNKNIKVQVVSGDYDLATPRATVDATITGLDAVANRVTIQHYSAGHMLYTDDKANHEWQNNSSVFYNNTIANTSKINKHAPTNI